MKKLICASMVIAAVTVAPFAADAAPKSGCPATPARWEERSVEYVGALLYSEIPELWDDEAAAIADIDQRFNRNGDTGDTNVCLAKRWEDLNPKSRWSGFTLYIVADNNANATK